MSDPCITDTQRLDFIAGKCSRCYGCEASNFRAEIDARILAERAAVSEWTDLTVEFPPDETPIVVEASDGKTGVVCYDSETGEFYLYYPTAEIHGCLWSEVHGPKSEVVRWKAAKRS